MQRISLHLMRGNAAMITSRRPNVDFLPPEMDGVEWFHSICKHLTCNKFFFSPSDQLIRSDNPDWSKIYQYDFCRVRIVCLVLFLSCLLSWLIQGNISPFFSFDEVALCKKLKNRRLFSTWSLIGSLLVRLQFASDLKFVKKNTRPQLLR